MENNFIMNKAEKLVYHYDYEKNGNTFEPKDSFFRDTTAKPPNP